MRNHVRLRLSALGDEIASTAARLARLRDRLDGQGGVVDECRLRMLIAETPLAGRELRLVSAIGGRPSG